jgi:hypothetical protein
MPLGNGTGPFGRGPMTGRRAGYCAGSDRQGSGSSVSERGVGRGRGFFNRGRGFRQGGIFPFPKEGCPGMRCFRWSAQGPMRDPDLEIQSLQSRTEVLRAELDAIEKRLKETVSGF